MAGAGEDLMARVRSRREFLRLTAGAAAAVTVGARCNSGSGAGPSGKADNEENKGRPTLRIAQWNHFVPAFDAWFDSEYAPRWGDEHGVRVIVDHFPLIELSTRAAAEVSAQRGHDLFQFTATPSAFEDEVIDHRELIEEVQGKLGRMAPLVERSIYNPKTDRFFGFSESWVPNVLHYRSDLWAPFGRPDTWQQVLAAAPVLKSAGNPIGIGMSSANDFDSSWSLFALMHAYGSSVQDEAGNLTINTPATVEAVKLGTALYRTGMTDDIFQWDGSANNRHLASGRGSLILNAISAIRAIESQDPDLAAKIALLPTPDGPSGRHAPYVVNVYVIWKFAENPEAAKQFLVDLALASQESVVRSDLYNLPSYPGAVPDLGALASGDQKARPPGKYAIVGEAESWSTNVGYPGYANAAMDEVFNQFLVPRMFAAAARGEISAEDAVKAAETEMKPIFDKWKEQGKI
ncbi:MAG: extracellular solute-binding protein [Actinomycetota bacterium]|nr:extracellular solute-binding protein [Actinomycetota bacterium]